MKHISCMVFLFWVCCQHLAAQRVINYQINTSGNVVLTDNISIPKIAPGYTLWLPEESPIKGMIVFIHPRRDTSSSDEMIDYALEKQLAVLYATTDNRLEFFFRKEKMQEILAYIQEVTERYKIPLNNLLYCGMSLEGTRALKLAIFGQSDSSRYTIRPRAIAVCDAPLDMVRFHRSMVRAKKLNFNSIAANEGDWVSGYLERKLGGTPEDKLAAYQKYSPYCYSANGGFYLDQFKNIAVRAYTEPDVNWWIKTRRKDYYSMNAIDLAAFINELKIRNHPAAELILTEDKGYLSDGRRHPHSWNIVDERALIDWFLKLDH